jgi:hypothetical protein
MPASAWRAAPLKSMNQQTIEANMIVGRLQKLLLEWKVLTWRDKIAAKTMKSPITNQKVMQ